MQQQNPAKRATIILGVLLAIVMVGSVFAPMLGQQATTSNQGTIEPTATVIATFPPPPSDFSGVKFDKVYLHPSGIFTIGQPEGWNASNPNQGPNIAQVNLINSSVLGVVDSYIEAVDPPITPADLSAHFNQAAINASWARFSQWEETSRKMEGDRLVIDFNVTLQSRTFVARQVAWTDGNWIYTVRVLVPENAVDFLKFLLDNFISSLQIQPEFKGMPLDWTAYYDPDNHHIIRFPSDWTVTDSAPGRPTSITSPNGDLLRVEARANTSIADEAAARAFVEAQRSGNTVVSVKPITRLLGKGFAVAYSYTTVDGGQESGLTNLLNSADGTLHIADLRFPMGGIDLNAIGSNPAPAAAATAEATAQATAEPTVVPAVHDLAEVMGSFYVIEPINLSQQSQPPTPTPLPTLAVTAEVTAEATTEAAPATAEATAAPTVEATIEAAPATAEATAAPTAEATSGS